MPRAVLTQHASRGVTRGFSSAGTGAPSDSGAHQPPLVVIDYTDVIDMTRDLSEHIETAYGESGLGLLAIRGIPEYEEVRGRLLPLAREFAMLPEAVQARYTSPESFYQFGWSRGVEKVEGRPDFSKGSYYNNPQYDDPAPSSSDLTDKYNTFLLRNIWPTEAMPALEHPFKQLGRLTVDVGTRLAMHCDAYVHRRNPEYARDTLTRVVLGSRTAKSRLLYYYPTADDEGAVGTSGEVTEADFSNWCGWHNDHGALTGLAQGMFFDDSGSVLSNVPDETAGLYVRTRQGQIVKPSPPPNCMLFQIGEASQVLSGGWLQATPHAVKAASVPGVGRATYAVFMQPEWWQELAVPPAADMKQLVRGAQGELLPPGVPALADRWKAGQTFGDFATATFAAYH